MADFEQIKEILIRQGIFEECEKNYKRMNKDYYFSPEIRQKAYNEVIDSRIERYNKDIEALKDVKKMLVENVQKLHDPDRN